MVHTCQSVPTSFIRRCSRRSGKKRPAPAREALGGFAGGELYTQFLFLSRQILRKQKPFAVMRERGDIRRCDHLCHCAPASITFPVGSKTRQHRVLEPVIAGGATFFLSGSSSSDFLSELRELVGCILAQPFSSPIWVWFRTARTGIGFRRSVGARFARQPQDHVGAAAVSWRDKSTQSPPLPANLTGIQAIADTGALQPFDSLHSDRALQAAPRLPRLANRIVFGNGCERCNRRSRTFSAAPILRLSVRCVSRISSHTLAVKASVRERVGSQR